MPSRSSQSPCDITGVTAAPASRAASADRFEIDMAGQVLLPGIGQHGREGVPAHRLKRVARSALA